MNANATTSRPSWHGHPAHDGAGSRAGSPCHGFTLIEMLMAMFILAIGLSAVVSVFYAAASLQRAAADDVSGMQVARNAEALLAGRGISEQHLRIELFDEWSNFDWDTDRRVYPMPPEMLRSGSTGPSDPQRWPLPVRAYPQVDPFFGIDPNAVDREYYWVPLIRDSDPALGRHDWQVFVFVLQKVQERYDDGDEFMPADVIFANLNDEGLFDENGPRERWHVPPRVWGLPIQATGTEPDELVVDHDGYLRVGDRMLVSSGVTARVLEVDGNSIRLSANHGVNNIDDMTRVWIGAPVSPSHSSPTRFILTLGGEVVR